MTAGRAVPEENIKKEEVYEQLDLFTDYMALEQQRKKENEALERDRRISCLGIQRTVAVTRQDD